MYICTDYTCFHYIGAGARMKRFGDFFNVKYRVGEHLSSVDGVRGERIMIIITGTQLSLALIDITDSDTSTRHYICSSLLNTLTNLF